MKLADALVVFGWALLAVAAALYALLNVGVLLLADCSAECVARGERLVVGGLLVGSVAASAASMWMALRKLRRVREEKTL